MTQSLPTGSPRQPARPRYYAGYPPLPRVAGYGLAVVSSLGVIFLKLWLESVIGKDTPFLLLFTAVFVSCVFGGTGPGIVAAVITGSVGHYFLLPAANSPFHATSVLVRPFFYAIECSAVILISRAHRHSMAENERLRDDLERRIRDFQTLWNETPVGLAFADDTECTVIRANPAFEGWLGIAQGGNPAKNAADASRLPYRAFSNGTEYTIDNLPLRRAASGSPVRGAEMQIVRDSGDSVLLHAYTAPRFDSLGHICGALGTFIDMTAETEARRALQNAGAVRQAIEEAMPAGIAIISPEGRQTYVNEAFCKMVGWSRSELEGCSIPFPYWPENNRDQLDRAFSQTLRGEIPEHGFELTFCRKEGNHFEVLIHLAALQNKMSGIDGWLAVVTDISHRKQMERALQRSEARYRSLLAATTAVVWSTDAEGRTVERQPSWEQYTGQTFGTYNEVNYLSAIHPDDREAMASEWKKCLDQGTPLHLDCRVWQAAMESYRWCRVRGIPLFTAEGTVLEWVGTLTDIHETRVRQEAQTFLTGLQQRVLLLSDPDAILRDVSNAVGTYLSLSRCHFVEVDLASDRLVTYRGYAHDTSDTFEQTFSASAFGPLEFLQEIAAGHTLVIEDAENHPLTTAPYSTTYAPINVRSFVAVPCMSGGKCAACLIADTRLRRAWSASDIEILEYVARLTWVQVENTRLYRAAQEELAQRRQAESALRESEIKFRALFENSRDAIGVGADSRILFVNQAFADLLGAPSPEALQQRSILSAVAPEDRERLRELARRRQRGEETEELYTYRALRDDGVRIDVENHVSTYELDGKEYTLVLARDVTARRRAEEAQHFLAQASEILASSLDYETMLARIADFAVPHFADWCLVDLLDDTETLKRVGISHADPEKRATGKLLSQQYPPRSGDLIGPAAVLQTKQTQWIATLSDDLLRRSCYNDDHFRSVHALGPKSVITVPIILRDQAVGALTFASAESRRTYTPEDVVVAESLAHRAALSIDNARLYRAAQQEIQERQRAQAEVEALNIRLRRAMTETHHRLKNNLQVISAMIDMQTMAQETDIPIAEYRRLSSHIRTLAAVHDLLTAQARRDGEAHTLSMKQVMEQLLPMLQMIAGERHLDYHIEDAVLPSRLATSLALIVNEVCTNALKHGNDRIRLAFHVIDRQGTLVVEDDGPGFPPDFDAQQSGNTGMELIDNLTSWDLRGTYLLENRPEGGARVTVTFPIP